MDQGTSNQRDRIRRLVIFGAQGDLTARYLMPGLAGLQEAGELPEGFEISAVGRRENDTESYRRQMGERLESLAPQASREAREAVVGMLEYRIADATDPEEVSEVIGDEDEPLVIYLALPPGIFPALIAALGDTGLPEGSRLVIEKPFGENLESARELNRLLHERFEESEIFRVDHFFAMQTVQNILGLRFANRIFEPLWNREHIERVEITWDESLALEGRAGYYDSAGALKDVLQNHLLQVLCLVAMEPPNTLGERDLRDRKVELLRAVRGLSPQEVAQKTLRARYTAGRIGEKEVPDYAGEEGVEPENGTETFARVEFAVENWRWSGVPFALRTGKGLGEDRQEVRVHFRPVPHLAFGPEEEPPNNVLTIKLDPERVSLRVNTNGEGNLFDLEQTTLVAELVPHPLTAYGHVILSALSGDSTLSIRADEAEESWRIVEPVLQEWNAGNPPLEEYPAGSDGPEG